MTDKQPEALLERFYEGEEGKTIIQEAAAELSRLQQCCRDVYEVWAGSEGIPEPQTATEAYLLSLVEQMRDAAKEGLK